MSNSHIIAFISCKLKKIQKNVLYFLYERYVMLFYKLNVILIDINKWQE